ncbi:MAG: hypothetical protein JOZ69_01760 [Myxococcales bacterium]|nr:hypothetical protein [Myxococcales bacterium]
MASVEGVGTVRLSAERAEDGAPVSRARLTFAADCAAPDRTRATERCVADLVRAGHGVREVRAARGSLEDVFAALTASDANGEEAA